MQDYIMEMNMNQNKIVVFNNGKKEISLWSLILDENFYDDEPEITVELLSKFSNSILR